MCCQPPYPSLPVIQAASLHWQGFVKPLRFIMCCINQVKINKLGVYRREMSQWRRGLPPVLNVGLNGQVQGRRLTRMLKVVDLRQVTWRYGICRRTSAAYLCVALPEIQILCCHGCQSRGVGRNFQRYRYHINLVLW